MNLSFSGCGFMGIYHIGAASAIREYAPQLFAGKITGASAGAMAAAGLICNICLGQATSDVLKIVIQARAGALGPMRPSFNLVRILRQGLLSSLPPDAHKICNGRLHISLTRFSDGKNVLVSRFDTMNDLVQALICSMFIPFYCGAIPPMYKGERYIDGGWSDNMPQLDENTITVSPFSGESDICPSDSESASFLSFDLSRTNIRFTARNIYRLVTALFPPHPEIMSEMCRQGFEDALRFLAQNDLLACTRCIAVRSSIVLTSERRRRGIDNNGVDQQQELTSSSAPVFVATSDEDAAMIQSPPPIDEITSATTPATPSSATTQIPGAPPKKKPMMARSRTTPRLPRIRTASSSGNMRKTAQAAMVSSAMAKAQASVQQATAAAMGSGPEVHNHDVDNSDDCESCRNAADIAVGKGLPKIVLETLAIAEAGERTLLTRLMGLAPIKWIRYFTVPWILPLDITYALCRKFLEWLPTISEDATWLIERATEAAKFILSEIEAQKSLYTTRFTCQMNITEMNYSNMLFGNWTSASPPAAPSTPSPSTQTSSTNLLASASIPSIGSSSLSAAVPQLVTSRRASMVSSTDGPSSSSSSQQPNAPGGQWTVSEGNLGFTVDLNTRSQNVRDMASIVRDDRPETLSKYPASRVAHVADGLGMEGLQKAVSDGANGGGSNSNQQSPTSPHGHHLHHHGHSSRNSQQQQHHGSTENVDLDAFASMLAFTRRQEALMAYYYLDENNQMKVTEIYGVQPPDGGGGGGSQSAGLSRSISQRQSMRERSNNGGGASGQSNRINPTAGAHDSLTKDDSGISGVSAPELEAAILAKVPGASVGYRRQSATANQAGGTSVGGSGVQRSASLPKHRRNPYAQSSSSNNSASNPSSTSIGFNNIRSKALHQQFISPISTASESEETEKLFVPDRRGRGRLDSEREAAAYEPEDSSGED